MKELNVAVRAAKEAGKVLMRHANKNKGVKFKSGSRDMVTNADIKANEKIISVIKNHFPEHDILSEEAKPKKDILKSENLWVIDPLDGTTNFAYNYPHFCTSIGFQRKNKLIAGVVFDPVKKELFYAAKGKGAFLNGKRICVSRISKIEQCLMGTDSPYDISMRRKEFEIMKELSTTVRDIRHAGSAALGMCYVARGRLDFTWLCFTYPWDVVAGVVIVREAGGMATNENGRQWAINDSKIVASNKIMHGKILQALKEARR